MDKQFQGFVGVLESFGKLCKLIIPLSRTWKILEKGGFSRSLFGEVLDFALENSRIS